MGKGKKILLIALAVLFAGALIIRVIVLDERCRYLQGSIDQMFSYSYSSLCLGIPVPEDISDALLSEKNDRNLEDAYICSTTYGLTSYHYNLPTYYIVKTLYDLCRAHVQRDVVDVELAQLLNRLAYWDFDEEKARSAWEALEKRMEETGVDPYR